MPAATFESFQAALTHLVEAFEHNLAEHKNPRYVEAQLRDDFLNPFFAALGWDIANTARLIQKKREVEIESRTQIAGRQKRADYLFRVDARERFVCEAKKPAEELNAKHCFQAKRYAWNKELPLALLTDFEDFKLFIVGGKPHASDDENVGLYKTWHFRAMPAAAREIWDLLARDSIAAGSIEKLIEALPKRSAGKGKYKQGWLIKPDRSRSLDVDFLNFLDEARRELASDLLKENDRADLLDGNKLNEATQRILDRILFLRICEDRDIDTGLRLDSHLQTWRRATGKDDGARRKQSSLEFHEEPAHYGLAGVKAPKDSLWRAIVRHFRNLDRRPASHVPFFNGNLFKAHFSEELMVSDEWLARFIGDLSDDESPYLFAYIPVEILGTIYERFLGKVVRPQGRGVTIEEKPEVRKAGGVYYTPRYIVEYIVAQTVEKLLEGKKPEATLKLRFLDPACGSGSFLIRVFEATCEYWQQYLTDHPDERKKKWCWIEKNPQAATDDVHLTMALKRHILLSNVYGVDLDPGAVEVTQLSLYLKMLENENRNSLQTQRALLPDEDDALLPPLENNIKCGNSLIASDFSMIPEELYRVRAFDWRVGFKDIIKSGGFDAIVGNPPYIRIQTLQESDPQAVEYLNKTYSAASKGNYDIYVVFIERAVKLLNPHGLHGFIVPHKFFNAHYGEALRRFLSAGCHIRAITHFGHQQIFEGATTYTCLLFTQRTPSTEMRFAKVDSLKEWIAEQKEIVGTVASANITHAPWVFAAGQIASILEKLRKLPETLETVTDRIFQGIKTSADKIYIVEQRARKGRQVLVWSPEKQSEYWLEDALLHPLIKGGDSRKYSLSKTSRLIIFPYETNGGATHLITESELRRLYPKTWAYLVENKDYLDNREDGRFRGKHWYQFGRAQALDVMPLPKIFTPDLAATASFSFDPEGECFFTGGVAGGYGILSKQGVDPICLLALLNSSLLNWIIAQTGTQMRGGYFSFEARFIRSLPIALPSRDSEVGKGQCEKLSKLAEKMLAICPRLPAAKSDQERQTLQNAVTATDQQIDALVYELYGLTEEEIKIVEGNA